MAKPLSCDVLIIGASLSGSVVARSFAGTGKSIIVIDSDKFPRRKACGEGLSNTAFNYLKSIGIDFESAPHQVLRAYRIDRGGRPLILRSSDNPNDGHFGIGIARETLDAAVLEEAVRSPDVSVLYNARAMRVLPGLDESETLLSDGRRIVSRHIVVAAGAGNSFHSRSSRAKAPLRFGYSLRAETSPCDGRADEVHIIANKQFELYATPIGGGILNLAVLAPKHTFAKLFSSDGQHAVLRLLGEKRGGAVRPVTDALPTGPVGSIRREATDGRIFFVGDACEQFDPIGGMGMTHALLSGELAGRLLGHVLSGRLTLQDAAKRYESEREKLAQPLRGFTRLCYLSLVAMPGSGVVRLLSNASIGSSFSRAVHRTDRSFSTRLSQQFIELAGR